MKQKQHIAIAFDATGAITFCKAKATNNKISEKVSFSCLYDESIYDATRSLKYQVNKVLYKNRFKYGETLVNIILNDENIIKASTNYANYLNSYFEAYLADVDKDSTIYLTELTVKDLIDLSTYTFKAQNKHKFYKQLGMSVPDYLIFTMFLIHELIKNFAEKHNFNVVFVKRRAQAARCFFCGKLHTDNLEIPIQNLRKYHNNIKDDNKAKLIIKEKNDISVHISTVEYTSLKCYFEQSEKMQNDFRHYLYSTMHITINLLRDVFPDVQFDLTDYFETIDYSNETDLEDFKNSVLSSQDFSDLKDCYADILTDDIVNNRIPEKAKLEIKPQKPRKKIDIMEL